MTRVTSLSMGYVYMSTSFEGGRRQDRLEYDLTIGGPYLGFAFRF